MPPHASHAQALEGTDSVPPGVDTCPEASAGFLSRATFAWLTPLLSAGYRAPLTARDFFTLAPDDSVASLSTAFEQHWQAQRNSRAPS